MFDGWVGYEVGRGERARCWNRRAIVGIRAWSWRRPTAEDMAVVDAFVPAWKRAWRMLIRDDASVWLGGQG